AEHTGPDQLLLVDLTGKVTRVLEHDVLHQRKRLGDQFRDLRVEALAHVALLCLPVDVGRRRRGNENVTRVPPAGRGPMEKEPPYMAFVSRMPTTPARAGPPLMRSATSTPTPSSSTSTTTWSS